MKKITVNTAGSYIETVEVFASMILVLTGMGIFVLAVVDFKAFWIQIVSLLIGSILLFIILKAIQKILTNTLVSRKLLEYKFFDSEVEIILKKLD